MAERLPEPVVPNLRVTLMLSSMGFEGEVDGSRVGAMLSYAEIMYLQDGEHFNTAPSRETTGYLASTGRPPLKAGCNSELSPV